MKAKQSLKDLCKEIAYANYAAGLRDGERRLARAVEKWLVWMIDEHLIENPKAHQIIYDWTSARLKRGKK